MKFPLLYISTLIVAFCTPYMVRHDGLWGWLPLTFAATNWLILLKHVK